MRPPLLPRNDGLTMPSRATDSTDDEVKSFKMGFWYTICIDNEDKSPHKDNTSGNNLVSNTVAIASNSAVASPYSARSVAVSGGGVGAGLGLERRFGVELLASRRWGSGSAVGVESCSSTKSVTSSTSVVLGIEATSLSRLFVSEAVTGSSAGASGTGVAASSAASAGEAFGDDGGTKQMAAAASSSVRD